MSTRAYLLSLDSSILLSYIRLSNLSCKACLLWPEPVGEATNCKFFTQGPHDIWYPGWSRPVASADNASPSKTDALFLENVEFELGESLKVSGLARPRAQSNNSNSSKAGMAVMDVMNGGKLLKKMVEDRVPF